MSSSTSKHGGKKNSRMKSGCFTCRIRRKKCDEQPDEQGNCQTCVRLRLQCLGFGAKRPDWMREGSNVADMREKIKSFLASNGMIKGHSAAPGDPLMEISPQDVSPPEPVASSSMQPASDAYPPGPPSSDSESASTASNPPIATLPPPAPRYLPRNELSYSLHGSGSQTPYQSNDALSPITPASIASQLSPQPPEAHALHREQYGNTSYHGLGEGVSSVLGLSHGRQTGERRSSIGSPSSSSASGSSGTNNTNGHGHPSRERNNALEISISNTGTRASTRHTSSRSPQQSRRRSHTASKPYTYSLTSPSHQHHALSSAISVERSLDTQHPMVENSNQPSSSAISLLSSPSLVSVSSMSNACSPRSTTNVPITPSDPHPSLIPPHYPQNLHTLYRSPTVTSSTATPSTIDSSFTMPISTPYSTGTYLTDPITYVDTAPSPDINYSSIDLAYGWASIGASYSGATFMTPQQNPWPLQSTPSTIVKPEPFSPRVSDGSINDTRSFGAGMDHDHYITGLGLGLDIGSMTTDMINNSGLLSLSPDIPSLPIPHHGSSNVEPVSATSDSADSPSAISTWTALGQATARSHFYAQQYGQGQMSPPGATHTPLPQPQFSPTESRREVLRGDPMLGVSFGQQPSYSLSSASPVVGGRDVHGTGYGQPSYEATMGAAMTGHGQASNSQYTGHPGYRLHPLPQTLRAGTSAIETSGDFSAPYNLTGPGVSRPVGAHRLGMALGGIGHPLDAQGPSILGQSDTGYISTHLAGFDSPMFPSFESIEKNNSDDSPRVVAPKPTGPVDTNIRSRATYTAFTNVPQDSELNAMLGLYDVVQFFPRGGMSSMTADTSAGLFFPDDQANPDFAGLTDEHDLQQIFAQDPERAIARLSPSYGLAEPLLEVNHADANLVKYYLEHVQPMQYFFVEGRVLDQIKELAITHPLLRDAICAVASVHQRRRRDSPPFVDLSRASSRNALPDAGSGEDDDGYKVKAQMALTRLAYSTSVAAQNAKGGSKVSRLKEADALAGLECVSIFLFEGGLGDWNVFLTIACDWVESILFKSSETAEQSGKDLWEVMAEIPDDLIRFVIRTTMWFEVLASITQMRKPRFFEYYRTLFGPLTSSRFQDVEVASYLLLNEQQGQRKREERRDQRFSMLEVMGCDNTTFLAIAEISALSAWKEEQAQNGCLSAVELVKRGTEIESRCLNRASLASSTASFGASIDNQKARRGYTSAIFYSAAKLYLHTVLSGDNPSVVEIRTYVRETVEALERVPGTPPKLRTSVIRSVVFPICIAGCMTEEFEPEGSVSSPSTSTSAGSPSTSTLGKRSRSSTQSSIATHDYRKSLLDILSNEARGAGNCGEVVKVMQEVWELRAQAKREALAEFERQQAKRARISIRGSLRDDRPATTNGGEVNWRQVLRKREAALLLV